MYILIGSIIGGLISAAGTLVGRVLLSLGLGYATYSGIDASITWAKSFALGKLGTLPAIALQIAGVTQVGTCISIICSALAARMVLKGMTGGAVKSFKLS